MPSAAEIYLQRLAEEGITTSDTDVLAAINTLLSRLPAALGAGGGLKVDGSGTALPSSDAGPAQTVTRTYTSSADMSTAAAITAAPSSGKKIVAMDIMVSSDTAMNFSIQMETSATVLAKVFIPANGTVPITLRGYLKGDTADKKLYGKASVSGNVAITAVYFSET